MFFIVARQVAVAALWPKVMIGSAEPGAPFESEKIGAAITELSGHEAIMQAGIVVTHHDLTGIVVGVTERGVARDRGRYDSGLSRGAGQGTLLSTL